nr:ribonuclease p protein subunit p29 [Quercus suber]
MAASTVANVSEALLRRAHSPETAETIFRERVRQRPLHLRPSSPDRNADARSQRQRERLSKDRKARRSHKPTPLSAKQKRALAIHEIPRSQQKYSLYLPLHALWCRYMREILGLDDPARPAYVTPLSAGPLLVSADYHGALLQVVRSRCPSRVGLQGIVVKDTKFTFELCTAHDAVKVCPKEHTVFAFEIPLPGPSKGSDEDAATTVPTAGTASEHAEDEERAGRKPLRFEIHGNQFRSRAPDRASKKVRMHFDPDL